jgi:large subunit ribosomal protein L10
MNRQEKENEIKSLRDDFSTSQAMFLVKVQGMSVEQIYGLRKGLFEQGGKLRVAKNTLAKIAVKTMPKMDDLQPFFTDQVAIVFAMKEAPAVAKVIEEAAEKNEKLSIVVGFLESNVIDKEMIKFLATIPPRPVLLANLCGTVRMPLVMHVSLLHQVLARFVYVIKQISEKK